MAGLFRKKKAEPAVTRPEADCETIYIEQLLGQIRCRKAHPEIEKEIRGHIEEQAEANIADGMEPEKALQAAVKDMGDPVETGVALDVIHRPQPAWNMIFLMLLISAISIFIHVVIGVQKEEAENFYGYYGWGYIQRTTLHTVIGFIMMLGMYLLDYSFIGHYAKYIGFGLIALLLACFLNRPVNGAYYWIPGFGAASGLYIGLLFVPVYGAILYHYRGSSYRGIIKSLLWMIVPSFVILRMPCLSVAVQVFYCMAVMLTAAVLKGWFQVRKKAVCGGLWGVILVLPMAMLAIALRTGAFLAEYQIMRLQAFISGDTSDYNYIGQLLQKILAGSRLLGQSSGGREILEVNSLPEFDSNYILVWIGSYYGILAAGVVCVLLIFLIFKVFRISLGQSNQLGMMIGLGCGMVFLSSVVINIMENLFLLPVGQTFLPFFSYGGSGTIVSYIIMGVLLSVYRYKNVLPANQAMKPKLRVKIELQRNRTASEYKEQ